MSFLDTNNKDVRMPKDPRRVVACIRLANDILKICHLDWRIKYFYHLTKSKVYTSLYETMCKKVVPDIFPHPQTLEDEVHNCQCVINSLSLDILSISMEHITGEDIVNGESMPIYFLLEIFKGLYDVLNYQEKPKDTQLIENNDDQKSDLTEMSSFGSSIVVIETLVKFKKSPAKDIQPGPCGIDSNQNNLVKKQEDKQIFPQFFKVLPRGLNTVPDRTANSALSPYHISGNSIKGLVSSTTQVRSSALLGLNSHDPSSKPSKIFGHSYTHPGMGYQSGESKDPGHFSAKLSSIDDLGNKTSSFPIPNIQTADQTDVKIPTELKSHLSNNLPASRRGTKHNSENVSKQKEKIIFTEPYTSEKIVEKIVSEQSRNISAGENIGKSDSVKIKLTKDSTDGNSSQPTANQTNERLYIPSDLFPSPVKYVQPMERSSVRNYYSFKNKKPLMSFDNKKMKTKMPKRCNLDQFQTMPKVVESTKSFHLEKSKDSEISAPKNYRRAIHPKRKPVEEVQRDILPKHERNNIRKPSVTSKDLEMLYQKYILEYAAGILAGKKEQAKVTKSKKATSTFIPKSGFRSDERRVPTGRKKIPSKTLCKHGYPTKKRKSPIIKKKPSPKKDFQKDLDFELWLQNEFPSLNLSSEVVRLLRSKHLEQLINSNTRRCNILGQNTKTQVMLSEAMQHQKDLLSIMQREQRHSQRYKTQKECQYLKQSVDNRARDERISLARIKRYYSDYSEQLKSKLRQQIQQDEVIFKKLFEKGLVIKKEQVRELEKFTKEKEEQEVKKLQTEIENIENFYKDQFAILVESLAEEQHDQQLRQKAQVETMRRMKSEFHEKMKTEIKKIEETLTSDNSAIHFRELDSERIQWKLLLEKPRGLPS